MLETYDGVNMAKFFTVSPTHSTLYPGDKAQAVAIAFKANREIVIKEQPVLKCQVMDMHLNKEGEVIASIPIKLSAKAIFAKYVQTYCTYIMYAVTVNCMVRTYVMTVNCMVCTYVLTVNCMLRTYVMTVSCMVCTYVMTVNCMICSCLIPMYTLYIRTYVSMSMYILYVQHIQAVLFSIDRYMPAYVGMYVHIYSCSSLLNMYGLSTFGVLQ